LVAGPLAGIDHQIALWFHQHLVHAYERPVLALSEPGSGACIGLILGICILFLASKRCWHGVLSALLIVPGGLLLNSAIKVLVHRHRPFLSSSFATWDGYSFPSGHTIGATLLYGMLIVALVPLLKGRHWKIMAVSAGSLLVILVGFSRIALGAHYLTDVIAAIGLGLAWLVICKTGLGQARVYHRRRAVTIRRAYRISRRENRTCLAA
jgi:undecaprenyl-diphosphatase